MATATEKEISHDLAERNSALDAIVDLMPFEMRVPGREFRGRASKFVEESVEMTPTEEACEVHQAACSVKNSNRRKADRALAKKAFARLIAEETCPDERTFAMMTACCMVSKITFEKFFDRVKKAIKIKDKKQKQQKRKSSGQKKTEKKKQDVQETA